MKYLTILSIFLIILLVSVGLKLTKKEQPPKPISENFSAITRVSFADTDYLMGCNNGGSEFCLHTEDSADYKKCINDVLVTCKTWAIQYKQELESKK
jgi:hypothetical protein